MSGGAGKRVSRRATKGVSSIVGAVIFVAIMVMFLGLYLYALEKFATSIQEALERVRETGEASATLSTARAFWSFNGSHVTIYMENQASKVVLVVAMAMVYDDGSYATVSRVNGSVPARVIVGNSVSNALALPLGVPPATSLTIVMSTGGKRPVSASLAVEASPIATVIAVPAKRLEVARANVTRIWPTQNGATTWLGEVAMPTTRNATTTKSYPQSLTPTGLGYDLVRVSRGAVQGKLWTDFEFMPSGWSQDGGSWGIVDGGFKGKALQGYDNDKGLGGASHFYNNTDLSGYTSLWASVKARRDIGTYYYGISMRDRDSKRLYTIEIYRVSDKNGEVRVRSYNVEVERGWTILGSVSIANYDQQNWYAIIVNYVVAKEAVNFFVWVYDASGKEVARLSAQSTSPNRFAPAYIGVDVDGPGMRALFDDFIVSTVDPRVVNFIDLPGAGYTICIYDNFGALVNCSTSTGSSASVGVVNDAVVGTGVDGRIVVKDPSGGIIVDYRVPQSDAVLGGDIYRLRLIVGGLNATFVDLAGFANCIKLFDANLSLYVTANTTVTLEVLVNGTSVYLGTDQSFDVFAPIPGELLGKVSTYNVTLLFNSTSPFNATVWWLRVTGLGLFEDRVIDALLIASDACIYFYDVTYIGKAESLDPSYVLQAYTEFEGSAAIAYHSGSYALYMVNRSGLYAWDPGWTLVTSECRSIGAGARVELVKGYIVILPGPPANYVYVYDVTSGDVTNKPLPSPYRLYQYTSSAIANDSVIFTALDDNGRTCLLMLNVTSMDVERLGFVPFYCVAGLAARGSMVYAVSCGLWSSATNMDDAKGIGVWVYDLVTNLSRVVLVVNSSYVKLLGYSDRVEVYGGAQVLLAVDEDRVHVIGLKDVPLSKEVPVYAT